MSFRDLSGKMVQVFFLGIWLLGCSSTSLPPDDGSLLCGTDEECSLGSWCDQGFCKKAETPCDDGGGCPEGFFCRHGGCVPSVSDGGDGTDGGEGEEGEEPLQPDIEIVSPPLVGDPPVYRLEFGNVLVGQTTEGEIVLKNAGQANLLVVQLSFEMGDGAKDFSLPPEILAALPLRLQPGQQAAITVRYRASDGLTDHAILDIISNDPDEALVKIHLLSEFKGYALATLSKSSLQFGDVPVGENSQPLDFQLINSGSGNAALQVQDIRTGILANPDFSLAVRDAAGSEVALPAYLNNSDFFTVEVLYHPQAREQDSDEVVIVTDDSAHPILKVGLSGRGVLGDLRVSPSPIDLGRVRVGRHAEQLITLANAGGASFELQNVTLQGASAEWLLTSVDLDLQNLPASPRRLSPGESVTVLAGFDPQDAGIEAAELVIQNTSPEPLISVQLQAEGYVPAHLETEPSPAVLIFGDVQLDSATGQRSQKTLQLIIRNSGGDPLQILSIQRASMTSPEFFFSPENIPPIASGQQAVLEVSFSPADIGSETGSLLMDTNDPDLLLDSVVGRFRIDVAANGTDPNIFLSPSGSLDFGGVYVGRLVEQTVRLRNAGVGPLRIEEIALTPGSSSDFSLAGLPQLPLVISNPTFEVTFQIRYRPDVLGPDSGALRIMSSDLGVDPINGTILMLYGEGTGCPTGSIDCDGDAQNGCELPCTPSSPELCNGRDDDCDCLTDEDYDLQSDINNCGVCGRQCSYPSGISACISGNCQMVRCLDGFGDCDHSDSNGCEININESVSHCGGCGNACSFDNASARCLGGVCVMGACSYGFRDCDSSSANGCETDIFFDAENCGSCGRRCLFQNGIGICSGGNCFLQACLPHFGNCDNDPSNGCEANLLADPNNCNGCNNRCPGQVGTPVCDNGVCGISQCNPGLADCVPGDPPCETNIWADVNNCGACGNVCNLPHANALCANGTCIVNNCQSGYGDCDDQDPDGCEIDLTSDVSNCGFCTNHCWFANAAASCQNSQCVMGACDPGFYNIDGQNDNGCECSEDSIASTCDDSTIRDLGTLANGATVQVSGNLIPSGDVDWYTFLAPDDNNEDITLGRDLYNVRVHFTANGNPQNQYSFYVYRNANMSAGCAQRGNPVCASLDTDYNHYYYNRCDPSRPTNCRANPIGPGDCQCVNNSSRYWVEVRRSGVVVTCEPYILEITFVR